MRILDVEEGDKNSNDAELHHILSENMFRRRRKNAPQRRLKVGHTANDHEQDAIIRHKARLHLRTITKQRPSGMRKRHSNMKNTGKKHDKKHKSAHTNEGFKHEDDHLSFVSSAESEGGIVFYVPENEEEGARTGEHHEPPQVRDEETSASETLPWRRETGQEPESSQMAHLVLEEASPQKSGEATLVESVEGMGVTNGSGASITASRCSIPHGFSHNTDLTDFTDSAHSKKHLGSEGSSQGGDDPKVYPGKYDDSQDPPESNQEEDDNDKFSTVCSLGESEMGGDCSLPPPWRSIPSIPEGGPPVRSPSASFEMDSLQPHPSNHSLRLSEAESRHSEPYPCMHHVIEMPHCRPSECELLPFGTRIELDLEQEDLDCWERVQRWLDGNADFLGGGHHEAHESPFLDDHSHALAVAAADRILDLHGLDFHHDLRVNKQTLRRHASHDILPHRGSHDSGLIRHGSPPITYHHHIHHPDWLPAVPSHSLYQRQMSVASSLGGTSSRSPSHDDQHDHIPFSASPPFHKHCLHLHRDKSGHDTCKVHGKCDGEL